jgi:hypothetical protein
MKQYLQYIEDRNVHQLHTEQLALYGIKELRDAINIFQSLRNDFLQMSSHSISTKWDGAPAIICGTNPENDKFFVSTKSALTKNPKICYTTEDVRSFTSDPDLQSKLIEALTYFPLLKIQGVLQGDLLFIHNSKHTQEVDGIMSVTFKANTITYAVDLHSPVGQQIHKAKIGVVFHTQYKGDSLNNLNSSMLSKANTPQSTPDIFVINPEISKNTPVVLSDGEREAITRNLSAVGKQFHILKSSLYDGINKLKMQVPIEKVINSYIRKGTLPGDAEILIEEIAEAAKSLYSGKRSNETRQFLIQNKEQFTALITIYKLLFDTKMIFVKVLEKIQTGVKSYAQDEGGLKITAPEGFVLANSETGKMVKLVDRLNFSKNNFNFVKNWGKNNV